MDRRIREDLDNFITGHYGEDQFEPELPELPTRLTERLVDFFEGVAVGAVVTFGVCYWLYQVYG